jgi:peptidyl-prolyl cis-trans isomerase C
MVMGLAVAASACGKEAAEAPGRGPAVLTVNEKSYTAADLEREIGQELRRAPREMQQALATKEGQRQFVDRLVRRELLLQEAEKRKIGDRPEVADQIAALRRDLMLRLLLQEEIGSKVKVEDKDVQEYFASHADEFSGDQVRARHILVRSEGEAKQVLERLANREPFEDVAKAVSRDPATASKGGDLDYVGREQMFPEFARAVFALKPGEVSGMVRTPLGFHVIKLVDRKKGKPLAYEQVKGPLQKRLLEERQRQRFEEWLSGLEKAAKVARDETQLPVGNFAPPRPESSGAGGSGDNL